MTRRLAPVRFHRLVGALAVLILVAAACGDDGDTEAGDDTPDETTTTSPTSTDAPADATTTTGGGGETEATTTTVAATTTTEAETPDPAGAWEPHEDGENDCQRNGDYSPAPMCMPPDIDTVTITRSSPLTIVTVFHAPVTTLDWQLTIGFDLDNDASTGLADGIWADFHGIGPDLEVDYFADNGGSPFAQMNDIAPGPVFTLLESGPPDQGPLAVWTWTDDQTLEVVISDQAIPDDATGFPVAGQTMQPDYHDAIPNEGPLAWP